MKHLINLGVTVVLLHLFIPLHSQTGLSKADYTVRPLFELDQLSTGEAYPWISDDGLRLYYTAHNKQFKVSSIWFSQRDNINATFDEHQLIPCNSKSNDNLSPWLSEDEKTIAFVQRTPTGERMTEIFISKRNSTNQNFNKTQKIELKGGIKGTVISPSFTQNMEQLYFFNEYKAHAYILIFKRESEYVYSFRSEMAFPKKYIVKSGKLSNDGLEYFISLDERRKKPCLYTLERKNLDENFALIKKFNSDLINHPEHRNHQVFFSHSKDFIVFTRSLKNEWDSNGIFIAQNKEYIIPKPAIATNTLHNYILENIVVFPNPSIDQIYFKNTSNKNLEVLIYDSSGRIVRKISQLVDHKAINISDLNSGSYYLRLVDMDTGNYRIIKHIKL